jgi:NADPH-dependent glutamate synthase beta subunit-like oxidoreductase
MCRAVHAASKIRSIRIRPHGRDNLLRHRCGFAVAWKWSASDRAIAVDANEATSVDRVYAAGSCSEPQVLVPAATGSGTTAAVTINARLCFENADRAVARTPTAARDR